MQLTDKCYKYHIQEKNKNKIYTIDLLEELEKEETYSDKDCYWSKQVPEVIISTIGSVCYLNELELADIPISFLRTALVEHLSTVCKNYLRYRMDTKAYGTMLRSNYFKLVIYARDDVDLNTYNYKRYKLRVILPYFKNYFHKYSVIQHHSEIAVLEEKVYNVV